MLEEIFALDQRLALANHRLKIHFPGYDAIHEFIDEYLIAYSSYNALSLHAVIELYNDFAKIYSRHLDIFQENNQYPFEYNDDTVVDRISYDVALILSCITNSSRYQIIHSLFDYIKKSAPAHICVLGAGAGIELALIKKFSLSSHLSAYDLSFNNFIRNHFSRVQLKEENFIQSKSSQDFDLVFAIELLEHVPDYKLFVKKIYQSLKHKGRLVCTTATNMPQFDHLYNFNNIESFKDEIAQAGFKIMDHRQFRQEQTFRVTESSNDWFILEKN